MKKLLSVLSFALFFLNAQVLFSQGKQVLTFESGRTTTKCDIQMRSFQVDDETINVELTLGYEMSTRELTLCIIPQKGSYDKVFIPMKIYDKNDVKASVRHKLGGKTQLSGPFKSSIIFDIGPAVVVNGATLIENATPDFKNEMLASGEQLVMHLRVDNPEKPVTIKLRNFSPVRTLETASGKIKYNFLYATDESVIEVKMPQEPCKIAAIINLETQAKELYDKASSNHNELAKAAGMKDTETCKSCKEKFEKEYQEQFNSLKHNYSNIGAKCARLDKILDEIAIIFNDADVIKCQKSVTPPPPPKGDGGVYPPEPPKPNYVSILDSEVKQLERLVNKISGNRGDNNTRTECETTILKIKERIASLDDKTKNKHEVSNIINSFQNLEQMYRKLPRK